MTESTRNMLQKNLESTREHLDELWDNIDSGETPEELFEELDELPLEIVWEKGEPFAVVLGTGGPHIEIRGGGRHDGSGYALHGYWSGEHEVIYGESITRTGGYFRELVEELDS